MTTRMMNKRAIFYRTSLGVFLLACLMRFSYGQTTNNTPLPVEISKQDPRYFQTTDGKTWVPIMMNYIVPVSNDEEAAFTTIERYFKNFSDNGGNALRIWISSPFLEIEDTRAGAYNPVKFHRIDRLLKLAAEYGIRIKFTLQHVRTIASGKVKQQWANSAVLAEGNGGPFGNMEQYITTEEGKQYYLNRAKALAARYQDNTQIFGWELWNEMDAVDSQDWFPFTRELLDSVQALFPKHLVTQTLGSLHSADAAERYERFFTLDNDPYVSLHRYIDPGNDWDQYSAVTLPTDQLVQDAVGFAIKRVHDRPVVLNEIGAVEANHAGPSKLYEVDTAGVLIHDMIFAPFFCGAAGTGGLWHWDTYVQRQNLWHHFARFHDFIKQVDPAAEQFTPFTFTHDGVRCYGLKGRTQTVIWCRDSANNWKTELQAGEQAKARTDFSFNVKQTGHDEYRKARSYNPWSGQWETLKLTNGKVDVSTFLRSTIVVLTP